MKQATADMLVSKALQQLAKPGSTDEALKLRKALLNGNKSSLLKRLAN